MLMKSVRGAFVTLILALIAIVATPANAALIQYDFTAQGFVPFFGFAPPTDPVSGSFTVDYDLATGGGGSPTEVSGLTIGSFTYGVTNTAFSAIPDAGGLGIVFQGSDFGVNNNNFMLQFLVASDGAPIVGPGAFSYTTGLTSFAVFQTMNVLVTTSAFAPQDVTVNAIPIPVALPLLLSGVAGLGLMGWRRRRASARA